MTTLTAVTPGTYAIDVFETPDEYISDVWMPHLYPNIQQMPQQELAQLLEEQFFFQEPWGADIVTNNSQHHYAASALEALELGVVLIDDDGFIRIQPQRQGITDAFDSAVLSTQDRRHNLLREGEFIVATLRMPKGRGLWGAMWHLPQFKFGEWPAEYSGLRLPEVDTVEVPNLDSEMCFYSNKHSYEAKVPGDLLMQNLNKHVAQGVDVFGEYHTYTIARDKDWIYYMCDGVIYASLPAFQETIMQGPWTTLFNVAVGGTWPGRFNAFQTVNDDMALRIREVQIGTFERKRGSVDGNEDVLRSLDDLEDCVRGCFARRRADLGGFPRD